ncbi:hypothetical protein P4S81_09780 [Pseudoalteromonas sp. B28]
MKSLIVILFSVFTLLGCSKPLPENKLPYVGEWQSKEMYLLILADGTVSYKRLKNGGSTSINAPLKEFVGDDFIVGLAFFTTTFDVTKAPYQEEGKWFMIVDGVILSKSIEQT